MSPLHSTASVAGRVPSACESTCSSDASEATPRSVPAGSVRRCGSEICTRLKSRTSGFMAPWYRLYGKHLVIRFMRRTEARRQAGDAALRFRASRGDMSNAVSVGARRQRTMPGGLRQRQSRRMGEPRAPSIAVVVALVGPGAIHADVARLLLGEHRECRIELREL